jgi:hypothetical protein
MINCYESNNNFSNFNNINAINQVLANKTNRQPIYINDTENNACGISIVQNERLNLIDIHYGAIPKASCNTSRIICDRISDNCTVAFDCCENTNHLLGFSCNDQYQITPINNTSSEYNKTINDCAIAYPDSTKCFQLSKIAEPTAGPTNSADNLLSLLYACYIFPMLVAIKNLK